MNSNRSQTFQYDTLNRTALSLSSTGGSFSQTYAYATGSNQLQSVTQGSTVRSISYTTDGNTAVDNLGTGAVFTYGYNNDNRMVQAALGGTTQASYALNYLGQRVIKSAVGSGTIHFHYDRGGHLIAESDGAGNVQREYVFLGDTPVAFITPTGGIDIIHTDHLGTPQKMTDASQTVVWDGGASDPFMMSALPLNPAMGLRLPGQYFDGETGLHYNYFRDYDPSLGRYVESDPIGLRGGTNTYAYGDDSPVSKIDPSGNCPWCVAMVVGGLTSGGIDLVSQLIKNDGSLSCVNWSQVGVSFLAGAALSGLGPTGFLLGRGGARAAQFGYSESAGLLNYGATRFGWGVREEANGALNDVLRMVANGEKTDIPGIAIPAGANAVRDGAVAGAVGGAATAAATAGGGD